MSAAGHISLSEGIEAETESILSLKDEKEIQKKIEQLKNDLVNNKDTLLLSGSPVSDEAIESIIEALSYGVRQAKIINKKYIPKKFRLIDWRD